MNLEINTETLIVVSFVAISYIFFLFLLILVGKKIMFYYLKKKVEKATQLLVENNYKIITFDNYGLPFLFERNGKITSIWKAEKEFKKYTK